jgi:hypothetical protein
MAGTTGWMFRATSRTLLASRRARTRRRDGPARWMGATSGIVASWRPDAEATPGRTRVSRGRTELIPSGVKALST